MNDGSLSRMHSRPPDGAEPAPRGERDGVSAPRIIVADDDDAVRDVVADVLRGEGYDVTEAVDGGRLLVMLARACSRAPVRTPERTEGADDTMKGRALVDLLVSDVRMPVCSGLQLLEQVRAVRWEVPVVLMTAFDDEATLRQARMLGARLLHKPFELDELRSVTASLLRKRA